MNEPEDTRRAPLEGPFTFACGPEVPCYTSCCHRLELVLYPYDVLRLKNRIGIGSAEFLERHTGLVRGHNPCFPSVVLRMRGDGEASCPFLGEEGCLVYSDRPSACRTYPLERGVEKREGESRLAEHWFLVRHPYCQGHGRGREWTLKAWLRDQAIADYNRMNDLWAVVDRMFADHRVWQGEGAAGPRQQTAFMACYDLDTFRRYLEENRILDLYRLDKARKKLIARDDEALLVFAFDWLRHVLAGENTLVAKRR